MSEPTINYDGDFANRTTFAGAPRANLEELADVDVAIVGAPFDWGTTYRPGARFGPAAIRGGNYLGADAARPHLPTGIDPFQELNIVDLGDFELPPGYIEESISRIRRGIVRIAEQDTIPIVLGGDHTIQCTITADVTSGKITDSGYIQGKSWGIGKCCTSCNLTSIHIQNTNIIGSSR